MSASPQAVNEMPAAPSPAVLAKRAAFSRELDGGLVGCIAQAHRDACCHLASWCTVIPQAQHDQRVTQASESHADAPLGVLRGVDVIRVAPIRAAVRHGAAEHGRVEVVAQCSTNSMHLVCCQLLTLATATKNNSEFFDMMRRGG